MDNKSYLFIVIVLLLSSCGFGNKVPDNNNNNNNNKSNNQSQVSKVDTIEWVEVPNPYQIEEAEDNNILEPEVDTDNPSYLDAYNISLGLPFRYNLSMGGSIHPKSEAAIAFYAGASMALDRLRSEQINLNVHVFDTYQGDISSHLAENSPNLVIGGYANSKVRTIANYAQSNKIAHLSPWNWTESLEKTNPYYLRVAASPSDEAEAHVAHAIENHSNADYVLVTNLADKYSYSSAKLEAVYSNALKADNPSTTLVNAAISNEEFTVFEDALANLTGSKCVFFVPIENKSMLIRVLGQLYSKMNSTRKQFVVYGIKSWVNENEDSYFYNYIENMETYISTDIFAEKDDSESSSFRSAYFNKYGTLPSKNAYLGFDLMLYAGKALKDKGANFFNEIDETNSKGIAKDFEFSVPTESNPNLSIDNKAVKIVHFKNSTFQIK